MAAIAGRARDPAALVIRGSTREPESAGALDRFRCPVDGGPLLRDGAFLQGREGRRYPVFDGIPILVPPTVDPTLWVAEASLELGQRYANGEKCDGDAIDTIALTEAERTAIRARREAGDSGEDPVIDALVGATNGILYVQRIGAGLPPPVPKLPAFRGATDVLDLGCGWGRWVISAAQAGHSAVGLDPSLGAVLAGRRLARRLGVAERCHWCVGDARHLPFAAESFDAVHSYSVLQHFDEGDAERAIGESARVLRKDGILRVQLAHANGLRSAYHRWRRRGRPPTGFDVRYWRRRQMLSVGRGYFEQAALESEGFFGLGMRTEDAVHFRGWRKFALRASGVLVAASRRIALLAAVADSLYLVGRRPRAGVPDSSVIAFASMPSAATRTAAIET